MTKIYKFVGADDIRLRFNDSPIGTQIKSVYDFKNWVTQTQQEKASRAVITATFVVDWEGYLRLASRYCEHVACSGSRAVLSAGEIFFTYVDYGWQVAEVTNQSTGFCPEPESWKEVAKALDRVSIPRPNDFTIKFIFRRCPRCGQINIVKEQLFLCAVCGTELPNNWNFD